MTPSILLALPGVASATTLSVGPSGGYATIRAAVQAAQPGDRIEVDAGTWDEDAITVSVDLELVGLAGSAGTVWNGPTAGLGFGGGPALRIDSGAVVTLEGFDLSGRSGDPSLVVDGAEVHAIDLVIDDQDAGFDFTATRGAIQATQAILTLDSCVLEGNSADNGGALWADGSVVSLTASLVTSNQGTEGGAIWARDSEVLLDGCQVEDNEAESGGAIRVEGGTLETQSGAFTGNRGAASGGGWGSGAADGGAILAAGSAQVTLVGTTFEGNTATSTGGALRLEGSSLAILDGSAFLSNTADYGGAVYMGTSGAAEILGALFDGNQATGNNGGAIRFRAESASDLQILDSLFRNNTAQAEGGALAASSATGSQAGALGLDGVDFFDNQASQGGGLDVSQIASVSGAHLRVCGNEVTGDGGGARVDDAGDLLHRWTNSTFIENVAGDSGGGLHLTSSGAADILNDSFLGNAGASGGGMGVVDTPAAVVNTLVAYTPSGDGVAGPPSPSVAVTYSLFWENVAADLPSALASGAGNVFADPLLASLSADGDCTNDQPWPTPGSPLIDAGDPSVSDPDTTRSDIGAYGGPDADWDDLADEDGDGFPGGVDCDDDNAAVNPDAVETCNGVDDDCSGVIDDGATDTSTFYQDEDGDGYGVTVEAVEACEAPLGYTARDGDCDDQISAVNPGAQEYCNGIDDDCDAEVDEGVLTDWWLDADGDGYGAGDAQAACDPPDQHVSVAGDCDDTDAAVNPDADDPDGDGVDANCDGADGVVAIDVDEGLRIRSGCGCSSSGETPAWLGLAGLALFLRRRPTARAGR